MGCRRHLRPATTSGQVTPGRFYVGDPIDATGSGAQARAMNIATSTNETEIALLRDAVALADAASRLEQDASTPVTKDAVALSLGLLEESLYALGKCCRESGDALIPPGDPRESLATRFARASAHWPETSGLAGPSRERQARILAALADTSAALHAAAAHCRRTRELIDASVTATGDERRLPAPPA